MILAEFQRRGVTGGREDVKEIGLRAMKKAKLWQPPSCHSILEVIRNTDQIIANSASTRSLSKKCMYI